MARDLIPLELQARLIANGEITARGVAHDPLPVVKLFTPDGAATWLLAEIDPTDKDRAFGLCDLGLGFPELGHVSLRELAGVRGALGLAIERDISFRPRMTLSRYAAMAASVGAVRT